MSMLPQTTLAPKTILVVDDDASVLTVVSYMLDCGGYNVLMAPNAKAALSLVERNDLNIDLVLLDVIMPDVPGPVLAERIVAIQPGMKILFMSGYTDFEVVRVKILHRGLKLLPKPFTSKALLDIVESVLNAPAHQSAAAGQRK